MVRNTLIKVEMICRSGQQRQILPLQTITDMKLHSIAEKLLPLVAAALLLLSHSTKVLKRMPVMSLTGVVSTR
ncbi:MAG: hypothetical protein ACXVI9_03690 [Mucilaginibacter sp.]